MRVTWFLAAAALLGACDEAADSVDALVRSGRRFAHEGLRPVDESGPVVPSIAAAIREHPEGRALLEEGDRAVPALSLLLDDPERRTIAAALLAEIGGTDAAAALLARWRAVRDDAQTKRVYRLVEGGSLPLGTRYEGIDHHFYAELLMALGRAGLPVSAEIAADTEAAITESERRRAAGESILFREERVEGGRRTELRWRAAPVETAREGLRILMMAGAPEAPPVFSRALRSPVRGLRTTALEGVLYLGPEATAMLPTLGNLLDDPELCPDALRSVAFLLDEGTVPDPNLTGNERAVLVAAYKARLREIERPSR
jgi:hypothetical protein